MLVGTARWASEDGTYESPWPSILALAYCAVAAGLFTYLRTDRAREALDGGTGSSLAEAQVVVAVSPTIVASVLHLTGTDARALWVVLGVTVVQLLVWTGFPRGHRRTSGE